MKRRGRKVNKKPSNKEQHTISWAADVSTYGNFQPQTRRGRRSSVWTENREYEKRNMRPGWEDGPQRARKDEGEEEEG